MSNPSRETCCCAGGAAPAADARMVRRSFKAAGAILLNILVAFFPKCPMCWAVYMSMLGGLGLADLAYPRWLLPFMLILMAGHLLLLYRKARRGDMRPFLLSLGGTLLLVAGRFLFPAERWLLLVGLGLIITASLWHVFSRGFTLRIPFSLTNK